jgi:hypothetical protein
MEHLDESNKKSDIDIIKAILLENDNDIAIKEKLYKVLYEVSQEDAENMDTVLIRECIETINLIEGDNEQLSDEKIKVMRQNIEVQYKKWHKTKDVLQPVMKKVAIAIVCIILLFSLTNTVVYAFGYDFIQIVTNWGAETFNLSIKNPSDTGDDGNISDRTAVKSIEAVFEDFENKPLLPNWVPDGFNFKYTEKFDRLDSTNILLYYENNANQIIIFDYLIYTNKQDSDINYEKDDRLVKIYEIDHTKHYILNNVNQIQVIWNYLDTVYNINGDISVDDAEKIINSMHGG